jgi:8-oxo-dGTP pyrophosphatase MutT (NUDIX family)
VNRADLSRALEKHAAADTRESESLFRIRRFLASAADPLARENPEGHVTASAVVARPDGSAFLVVFHRKLSRWLQPGGHAEEGDASAFEAALREAREETGIARFEAPLGETIFDVDVHAIPAHGRNPAHHHFDVRFLVTAAGEPDPDSAEDPSRPMRWMSLAEARAAGVDPSLARALEKAHAILVQERA